MPEPSQPPETPETSAAADGGAVIEQAFGQDGPHTGEQAAAAAHALAVLIRQLNTATRAGAGGALASAATLNLLVAELEATIAGLHQLLGQLASTIEHAVLDGGLDDDRAGHEPLETATHAAYWLGSPARSAATELRTALQAAGRHTTHLGNHTSPT